MSEFDKSDVTEQIDPVGVLLVNLGTPEAPETAAVRRYLKEFLTDPRVIEAPKILWWAILRGLILPFRTRRSAAAYAAIWDYEHDDSPLRVITGRLTEKLVSTLGATSPRLVIEYAMRYGQPSIRERLKTLMAQGCHRILIAPLYPQYSATTTASVVDAIHDALTKLRIQPTLRWLPPYYKDPLYIAAVGESIKNHLANLGWTPEVLLASFHGLPQRYVEMGDPYPDQCRETLHKLREKLLLPNDNPRITFQSRLGPIKWLKPYTDSTLNELAREGIKRVVVTTPGFATDCLETLEEIALRARHSFLALGGEAFSVVPCLNDSSLAENLVTSLLRRELAGWVNFGDFTQNPEG